ncbi:Ice nucleation protein, partial [Pseudomonas carnis]|nr:Ice nucleation protein [Pseudomonas carnis]
MNTDKVLVLRTCANNMSDHCGLIWPVSGVAECKYWKPTRKVENGLSGLLWGKGASTHLNMQPDARWVVCEVLAQEVVVLDAGEGVKFPRAEVVHVGTRSSAARYIVEHIADYPLSAVDFIEVDASTQIPVEVNATVAVSLPVTESVFDIARPVESVSSSTTLETATYGSTLTGANQSQLIAGYGSTETAGDKSTLIAGYGSTGTSGSDSSIIAGYGSTQTAGEESSLTAGYGSTQTAQEGSDLTAGYGSTGTAGSDSSLIAGYGSTQTAGEESSLTAGYGSTQTAQEGSDLTAGYGSTGTAGSDSSLIAGYGSTQTAGEESSLTA